MIEPSDRDDQLGARAAALVDLARQSFGEMSERQRIAGAHALRGRLAAHRRSVRLRRAALATATVTAACAAASVLVVARWRARPAPLAVRVDGAPLQAGGAVEAAGDARRVVHFSDGSEIALGAGARVHVAAIDDHGAHVTLDHGEAHVYVVHAADTRWTFDAGPFAIAVRGTAFDLVWRESVQRLDVRLENGAVTVSGPVSDGPLSLRAGQWLTIQENDVRIRSLTSGDGAAEAPSFEAVDSSSAGSTDVPAAPHPAIARDRREESVPRTAPEPPPKHRWVADLAAGKFASIVSEATEMGLEAAFAQSSADELGALADAARYTRRPEVARGALLAERRRFPGSEHALSAAFDLGRLAESEQDLRGALGWFDTYLGEAPNGTYASEALGRKMTLVQRLSGAAAARPLADAYVRRFPGGAYAEAARALIATP